jgi:Flp pilus assembly protein TadD
MFPKASPGETPPPFGKLAICAAAAAIAVLAGPASAQQASNSTLPAALAPAPPAPARPTARATTKTSSAKVTAAERAEADRMDPLAQVAFWDNVVQADPRDITAELKLAKAFRALSRYDEAEAAAGQALVVEPNNIDALLESARDQIAAGQGFFAIAPAQRAAELAPRDWRGPSLLAIALEQDQRDEEALAAHRKALDLAPNNPAALSNLGMFEASHGQVTDGESLLRRAVSQPSATAQERENLALILGMEGRFDEAEQLERRDLPPALVENNLAYLHAAAAPASQRTWDSVGKAQ